MNSYERQNPWKFLNALLKTYSLEELNKMGIIIPESVNPYQYLNENYSYDEILEKYTEYETKYMGNYVAGDEAINARNVRYVYIAEFSDDGFLAYFLGRDGRVYLFDKSNMKKTGKTYEAIGDIVKQLKSGEKNKEETA